jgi:hypothetical protein
VPQHLGDLPRPFLAVLPEVIADAEQDLDGEVVQEEPRREKSLSAASSTCARLRWERSI